MRTNNYPTKPTASNQGGKKMEEKTQEPKPVRVSSAYTRVVGNKQFDVVNTKQQAGLPKKAYTKKWAVIRTTGNRRAVIGSTDKKYPAIDVLLAAEKVAKAEAAEAAKNDEDGA